MNTIIHLNVIIIVIAAIHFLLFITVGSNFSFINYFKYKEDYMKWYTMRQKYIPLHKRTHFTKKQK